MEIILKCLQIHVKLYKSYRSLKKKVVPLQTKGCETAQARQLMQASLLSLNRSCAAYTAKAIRQEAWSKRCSPFAITVNIIIDIPKII